MRRMFNVAAACVVALAPASLAWSQQNEVVEARAQADEQRPNRAGREEAAANRGVSQLATLIALGNHMEIELGQLAAQKSNNEQVRQFAQKMVRAHTEYQQKLEPFNPQMAAGNRNRQRLEAAGERQREARAERQQSAAGRPLRGDGPGAQVALMPIIRDAAQRNLEMTKEMLSNYEGQDFDMGYLGQQIIAHTEMLAKLQAMQGKGTPEFQQVVEQGMEATQGHLEMAKSLARTFEDRERAGERDN
ncbi:DUF4142 domain-containing protein [Candidatus Laterigemmans baculatus]|uniref:DUF4142 domain-containing protein n=1 Tax=Candidatus Laterigemmans baculatus TaxID=2770505 RepID=UPI0013DD2192|nr:DUF4142 domain-containing protein [Candidatus Laterigemmans baculatus]